MLAVINLIKHSLFSFFSLETSQPLRCWGRACTLNCWLKIWATVEMCFLLLRSVAFSQVSFKIHPLKPSSPPDTLSWVTPIPFFWIEVMWAQGGDSWLWAWDQSLQSWKLPQKSRLQEFRLVACIPAWCSFLGFHACSGKWPINNLLNCFSKRKLKWSPTFILNRYWAVATALGLWDEAISLVSCNYYMAIPLMMLLLRFSEVLSSIPVKEVKQAIWKVMQTRKDLGN